MIEKHSNIPVDGMDPNYNLTITEHAQKRAYVRGAGCNSMEAPYNTVTMDTSLENFTWPSSQQILEHDWTAIDRSDY